MQHKDFLGFTHTEDKIQARDHSNESYWAVLSLVCIKLVYQSAEQGGSNF